MIIDFRKLVLFLLFILLFISCISTKKPSVKQNNFQKISVKPPRNENFPKDWIGNYQGELQIYSVDSTRMNIDMKLAIAKKTDSIYNWIITYNIKGKEDIRAYELDIVDTKKGHYIIDEKNSIKIDAFYRNKIFTSFFKVMNSYIVATYTKENKNIIFEIISATDKNTTTTGNTKFNDKTIPEVITYFVNGRQKAILKKQ
jgi:hypothetical protein